MKKQLTLCSLIALFAVSCGPKISTENQSKMDELTLKIDSSVDILMNQIDSSRMVELTDDFFMKQSFFENDMKDTVDRATIFLIDEYMRNRKSITYLRANYEDFLLEAKTMQKQLKDLKHDVDARLVDDEQFKKYYELEYNNFLQLDEAVNTVRDVYLRIDTQLVDLTPKMDSIIKAYKAKVNE